MSIIDEIMRVLRSVPGGVRKSNLSKPEIDQLTNSAARLADFQNMHRMQMCLR